MLVFKFWFEGFKEDIEIFKCLDVECSFCIINWYDKILMKVFWYGGSCYVKINGFILELVMIRI